MISIKLKFLFLFVFCFASTANGQNEECTIGVASGIATSDGRPLIWKTRDNSSAPNNEVVYNKSFKLRFLEVVTAGNTNAWMGVNEHGFAILNSLARDLEQGSSGYGNGSLMRDALGTCATVSEFIALLYQTNSSGRATRGNFATLDSTGAAILFEIDKDSYWIFDAENSLTAPNGYIIRTNFAENGDGTSGSGYERYNRSSDLIHNFYSGDSLNYRSILRHQMRDFSDFDSNPVNVPFADYWLSERPYGYIYTNVSICRSSTVSTTVIQGILSGERTELSTMWTILGHPAASIAVPYWPIGNTPDEANGTPTAPLCDMALKIRSALFDYPENEYYLDSYKLRDEAGNGIWNSLFSAEDSIFTVTEKYLEKWRANGPDVSEMMTVEYNYARFALDAMEIAHLNLLTGVVSDDNNTASSGFTVFQNFPNPFHAGTRISFTLPQAGVVNIDLFNISGKKVDTIAHEQFSKGLHTIFWNTTTRPKLSSGIYFYRITVSSNQQYTATRKFTLIK
ncbi:MAG: T9SS C-terminal target domain-containing protein [Calditrichaeota bacterium]|nr:MAG: T9SS C-terminal target domain-containing protein [Calditrichota bacterium]